jgi:hypothetical protein
VAGDAVTRLGMGAAEMDQIAEYIARVLVEHVEPEVLTPKVTAFRESYQALYYCVGQGLSPARDSVARCRLGRRAPSRP